MMIVYPPTSEKQSKLHASIYTSKTQVKLAWKGCRHFLICNAPGVRLPWQRMQGMLIKIFVHT